MEQTVSDLADGQLQGEAFAHALQLLDRDADARATWLSYHVIGDVLRSPELAAGADTAQFVSRLRSRLAQEPAPVQVPVVVSPAVVTPPVLARGEAANTSSWRWKLAAGLASVAAVAAIGWNMAGGLNSPPARAELAQSAPATTLAAEQATPMMIRDPRLDELLAAHRQNGGASALQGPSGFLRNATFEAPAR